MREVHITSPPFRTQGAVVHGGSTNVLAQSMVGGIGFAPASFTATSSKLDYHVVQLGLNIKSDP